eukprot:8798034-Pyramimonas_sp.AAC.1
MRQCTRPSTSTFELYTLSEQSFRATRREPRAARLGQPQVLASVLGSRAEAPKKEDGDTGSGCGAGGGE